MNPVAIKQKMIAKLQPKGQKIIKVQPFQKNSPQNHNKYEATTNNLNCLSSAVSEFVCVCKTTYCVVMESENHHKKVVS